MANDVAQLEICPEPEGVFLYQFTPDKGKIWLTSQNMMGATGNYVDVAA